MNSYISGIKPNHNLLCDYANPLSLYFIKHLSLLLISSSSCFLRWSVYFIFLKELSILFTFSSHWHVCTVPIIMSLVFVICSLSFFCYSALSEICPFYFLFFKEQALVLLILLLFFSHLHHFCSPHWFFPSKFLSLLFPSQVVCFVSKFQSSFLL